MDDSVIVTKEAKVATIRLNRPLLRNALSQQLRQALMQALEALEHDPSIRTVILTGTGKAFCAGLDLNELKSIASKSSEENHADSAALAALFLKIYNFPKPVIAALNGHAIAGGAGLALVCDFVIMSKDAKLGYSEARIGFVAALVGVFLTRLVGERTAKDLLLSARLIDAPEALAMGLINDYCAADEVLAQAKAKAAELALNAPSSLAMTKALVAAVQGVAIDEGINYAIKLNALSRTTDDLKEGVSAFLEKREASWRL